MTRKGMIMGVRSARYTIKHTPVHTDTHDNINLILVNEILLFNMILVLEYQCL